jgi:endogenous inhibitor of DNA gyrase (YacG/DUF329 family)
MAVCSCGIEFTGSPDQTYCGQTCRARAKVRRRQARDPQWRPLMIKPCTGCGVAHSRQSPFCSDTCYDRDFNAKWRLVHPVQRRAQVQRYYQRNKERLAGNTKERLALARAFIDGARAGGCVDCGEKDLRILESDHVRGTKLGEISKMARGDLSALWAELDKCETRCPNCHRRVTAQRRAA